MCHFSKSATLNDEFFAVAKKGSGIIFLQGWIFLFREKPFEAVHMLQKGNQNGIFPILIKLGCPAQKAQLELGLEKSHSLHQELLVRLCVRPVGGPGQLDKVTVWEKLANSPDFSVVPPERFLFA